jgi:hypothetical protein
MKSHKDSKGMSSGFQEINGDPLVELTGIIKGKELSGFLITGTKPVKFVQIPKSE